MLGLIEGFACTTKPPGPEPAAPATDDREPQPNEAQAASAPSSPSVEPPPPTSTPASEEPSSAAVTPFQPIELTDVQRQRAVAVQRHVRAAAERFHLDPNLINAIIWAESKFNPRARNPSGARGLMQLMPRTGSAMAKQLNTAHRPYDPKFSVMAGAQLLANLRDKFDGDPTLMLFAYARGSGTVRNWQKHPQPIPEGVQRFIHRIERARQTFEDMGFP